MAKHVHIKIADQGWILEKCAREIASRAPNITFGIEADPSAHLQYYINYSARAGRTSSAEVAFFTHSEKNPNARKRYFDAARDVNHCVCMSARYAEELIEAGISPEKVTTIVPGIDLDVFRPKVRIGVIGRTYHTGRKGEALVAQVMDIPGIEWRFTGSGWPDPSTHIPEGEMAEFYNDLDYVLIPSHYEGGPMSVLEGLACGIPIISSDVGWVKEYPHIPFENGNPESLRQVLGDLVAKREVLRSSVQGRTWDAWAEQHLQLFERLLGERFIISNTLQSPKLGMTINLLTHGSENKALGGPSVRVPQTAAMLRKIGIAAKSANFLDKDSLKGDLIHLFNIWSPRSSIEVARAVSNQNKHLVFSPILLDLSEIDFWHHSVLRAISGGVDETTLQKLEIEYLEQISWSVQRNPEPCFTNRLREIADLSDALIFLSKREQTLFRELVGEHDCMRLIHNPVDTNRFGSADPQLFRDFIGLNNFILCVGRIEPRKNQLFLVAAAKQLGLPVVLIGHATNDSYAAAVRNVGGDAVHFVGRLESGSDLLRSAYAACRVFALPSWAEGAPLAALEAAASGANMVLSNRSGEQEYFGPLARYVDPSSIESLKAELHAAWNDQDRIERSRAVREKVQRDNSWDHYAKETAVLYREVLEREPKSTTLTAALDNKMSVLAERKGPIWVELSTTLNAKKMTGINRVEALVSRKLIEVAPEQVTFIVWNQSTNTFLQVPPEHVTAGTITDFIKSGSAQAISPMTIEDGQLLVMGSGWFQNPRYTEAISVLASSYGLALTVLIHDIIPTLRPHWLPEKYAPVFAANLRTILQCSSRILANSENTAKDVRLFAAENGINCSPILLIKLANDIDPVTLRESQTKPAFAGSFFATSSFILAVGAIHTRKNYGLLYDCWVELKERLGASCPHLVIVGGVAWNGCDTGRALKEDPRLKGFVHILEDVNDEDLAWLYRNCLFTVYPSLYEGWGLPVAESLAAGKLVLASNTSSIPEIAPELCELIDPRDRSAWVAKIIHYTLSPSSRMRREEDIRTKFTSVTWSDTVKDVLKALAAPMALNQKEDLYTLDDTVSFSAGSSLQFKSYGWHLREQFGSWAAEKHAGVRLVLRPQPRTDLLLAVKIQLFGKAGSVRVSANGEMIARWEVPAGLEVISFASIPKRLLKEDGKLELNLESPHVIPVQALNPKSGDLRTLALGLSKLQIVEMGSNELGRGILGLPPFPLGKLIPLSGGTNLIHTQGFYTPEPAGLWSKFKHSEMILRVAPAAYSVLRLELCAPLAKSARARLLVIRDNDRREIFLHGGGNEVVWIPLENGLTGMCTVIFLVDSMFVPALYEASEDKRELGILVKSIAVLCAAESEVPTRMTQNKVKMRPEPSVATKQRLGQRLRRGARRIVEKFWNLRPRKSNRQRQTVQVKEK